MAYSNWLQPSKLSGSGDDTVGVSAKSDNTGRSSRSTTITFKASGVADVARTVTQSGKPEFVSIQGTAAPAQAGGTLTLSGTSNSSKLTFSKSNDGIGLTIPASYTANSVSTTNGAAISGDPGASAQFSFSIAFTVPANTTVSSRTCQITVTDNAGNTANCTITQAAGAATLSVTPSSVTLDWDSYTEGTNASFTVTSNTSWTVE